jgi:hypothetical protein
MSGTTPGPLTSTATTVAATISAAHDIVAKAKADLATAEASLAAAIDAARSDLASAGQTIGLDLAAAIKREAAPIEAAIVAEAHKVEAQVGTWPAWANVAFGATAVVIVLAVAYVVTHLR